LNEIRENNRDNNYKSLSIYLAPSGAAAGIPNLNIIDITLEPAKPKAGKMTSVKVSIQNNGDGDALAVKIVFYVDDLEDSIKTINTVPKNGYIEMNTSFDWKAKSGMHELKFEVYVGTSAEKDDQLSKVVKVKGDGTQNAVEFDPLNPIFLVILILVIIAIIMLATGGKGGKDEKGFVEEEHEDEMSEEE
jgi:hypothetical protein